MLSKLKKVFEEEYNEFYSFDKTNLQQRAKTSLEAFENSETRSIKEFKADIDHWKSQQTI